jgi:hypothetical protein
MTTHTCAITGQPLPGKAYILKTTEGEELVSPEALLHPDADAALGDLLMNLAVRVQRLEEALEATRNDVPPESPQVKTKRAPAPRKTVD